MLTIGFAVTMSGRWPRELPEQRRAEYGAFIRSNYPKASIIEADGVVNTRDDVVAAARKFKTAGVDLMIMVYGAFTGDDIPTCMAQELRVPIVLWAPYEPPFEGGRLLANALVAATMNAASLGRLGHKAHFIYGGLDEPRAVAELNSLVEAYGVIRTMNGTLLGLFGYRPTAFYNSAFDEGLIRKTFGIRMEEMDLKIVFDAMAALDPKEVEEDMKRVAGRFDTANVPEGYLDGHSRLYLAMKTLMGDLGYDYATLKCWPEMGALKTTPCAVLGRLADDGKLIGCEGDIDAMLAMVMQNILTGTPGFIIDMINIDEKENTLTYWHCGNPAPSLVDTSQPCQMCSHPLAGQGTALWSSLKEGPITSARLCNIGGVYKLFVSKGVGVPTKRNTRGSMVNVRITTPVREFVYEIVRRQVPHHYSLVWGDVAEQMKLTATLLGLEIIELS